MTEKLTVSVNTTLSVVGFLHVAFAVILLWNMHVGDMDPCCILDTGYVCQKENPFV